MPGVLPGKKSVSWRQDHAILERLPKVEARLLEGWPHHRIAAELGIAPATVSLDRKRLNELWLEQVGGDVKTRRLARIAQLDALREKAERLAERHERYTRAVLTGEPVDGKALRTDDHGKVEFRSQAAALLGTAEKAVVDAARIEGLIVDKVAPTDADGRTMDLAGLILAARTERE